MSCGQLSSFETGDSFEVIEDWVSMIPPTCCLCRLFILASAGRVPQGGIMLSKKPVCVLALILFFTLT